MNRKLVKTLSNDWIIITLLYSIAYGLMLFNDGVYWDGWILFNVDNIVVIETFKQAGSPFTGFLHSFLENPLIYRLIVFLSYYFSGLLFLFILKQLKETGINDFQRLILVSLFILFPVNEARVSMINMPSALCVLLFFIASTCLVKYLRDKYLVYRVVSLLVFFISFQLNSLLVFYLIPFLLIMYHEKPYLSIYQFFVKNIKYIDFILLPLVYFFLKLVLFTPYGDSSGYNIINAKDILLSPISMIISLYFSFFQPIIDSFKYDIVLLSVIAVGIYSFLNSLYEKIESSDNNNSLLKYILFGVLAFCLAVFPYLAIGRSGMSFGDEFQSRDQVLTPLGAAFILTFGLMIIFKHFEVSLKVQKLLFSIFISAFIITNISILLDYQRDWFKQLSIMDNFRSSEVLRNNTCFLFDDKTRDLNAIGRFYRFYEYTGIMKYVYGDEKRFGISTTDFEKSNRNIHHYYERAKYPQYNYSNFDFSEPKYKIIIDHGSYNPSLMGTLKTLLYKWINRKEFNRRIKNIVSLRYENVY